jgi:hypothetical protein
MHGGEIATVAPAARSLITSSTLLSDSCHERALVTDGFVRSGAPAAA